MITSPSTGPKDSMMLRAERRMRSAPQSLKPTTTDASSLFMAYTSLPITMVGRPTTVVSRTISANGALRAGADKAHGAIESVALRVPRGGTNGARWRLMGALASGRYTNGHLRDVDH